MFKLTAVLLIVHRLKMRILLCQSYLGPDEPPIFPLGLSCIAAALEGHEVRTYDPNVSGSPMDGLAAAVEEFQP